MRRDPEAIRTEVAAIAKELQGKRRRVLELLAEAECQTPEIPGEILDQREAPPLVYYFGEILQAAEEELGTTVEILGRLVGLDGSETAAQWHEDRQKELFALVEATMHRLADAHIQVGNLAVCVHNGLSDEQVAHVAEVLSAIRDAAKRMVASDGGRFHISREEDKEEEEGRHEGENPR